MTNQEISFCRNCTTKTRDKICLVTATVFSRQSPRGHYNRSVRWIIKFDKFIIARIGTIPSNLHFTDYNMRSRT